MKFNSIIIILLSFTLIVVSKADKLTELKTILFDTSNNVIDKLNQFLLVNHKVDNLKLNLNLSKKDKNIVLDNLVRSYKEKYPNDYALATDDSGDIKKVNKELMDTLNDYLSVYQDLDSKIRPLLEINKRAIKLKESLINSSGKISELEKERKEKETSDFTESDNNGSDQVDQIKQNKFTGLKKRKAQEKKVSNKEFLEKYLSGDKTYNYITNYPDFSESEELFGNFIADQGQRGVCYTASASMMYSIAINTILKRNKQDTMKGILDIATIALCSTYKNTFDFTPEEKKDLKQFNSLIIFKNYNFNSADGGGFQGPTAVWIKHHLDKLYQNANNYSASTEIEMYVPLHKQTLGLFGGPNYSKLCKDRISKKEEEIKSFSKFLSKEKGLMEQINNIKVINPRKRITDSASIKKLLIENGPFVFTIEVSSKGQKILGGLTGESLIHKDACNGNFFQSLTSGGHAILAVGVVKKGDKEFLKFKNSWDDNWGDKGYAYLELTTSGSTCNFIKFSNTINGSVALQFP